MKDERNNLIKVGDALDAITEWLCVEELRHHIDPNRKVNRFFATVMLENVPRLADRKCGVWVPADTPPECEDRVICQTRTKKGIVNMAIGYHDGERWCCGMNSNVEAWTPLPEEYGPKK